MDNGIKREIRILVAEANEVVSCGVKTSLNQRSNCVVVGEASSCKQVLPLILKLDADVVLLDLALIGGDAIGVMAKINEFASCCKVLIYTNSTDKQMHLSALRSGAVGIVYHSATVNLLCKAIHKVCVDGEVWVGNALVAEMCKDRSLHADTKGHNGNGLDSITNDKIKLLTSREYQIASLASRGLTAKLIGKELFVSEKTVRNKLTVIYSKLAVKSQLDLSVHWCGHDNAK